jgi:Dolichyl-phosphate-mannose-protein mannosyltransferase
MSRFIKTVLVTGTTPMDRIQSSVRWNWFLPTILAAAVVIQWLALMYAACQLSTTRDEPANIVAGLEYWEKGSSMRYNVNPPLVKLWATLPLHFWDRVQAPRLSDKFQDNSQERHEFALGREFVDTLGEDFFDCLVTARRMCLWFAVAGTVGTFALAGLWVSERAAVLAALLWAFNPITLGYGSLVSCDIPAASIGCWAVYCGVNAFRNPSITSIAIFGCMLGLAALTKLTWILLFPLAIVIVLLMTTVPKTPAPYGIPTTTLQKVVSGMLLAFLLAWVVILIGYRCEGVFRPLGEYIFVSNLLTSGIGTGNRFANTFLAHIPVPIPSPMLFGLDQQWQDFDHPRLCYLAGEWQRGGWYYYYFIALLVKLPLGLILLFILSMGKLADYRETCCVCIPILVTCFALVSSKTNMNEHTRYLWIILPQIIIVASLAFEEANKKWNNVAASLCVWSVASGLWSFPCGISYFNEMTLGIPGGRQVLAGCNIDWGHGWITARHWLERHETSLPVVAISSGRDHLSVYGIHTSSQAPSYIDEADPMVLVLIAVDERLVLQRDYGFPGKEHARKGLAGCCVEIYEMRHHELSQVNWLWVIGSGYKAYTETIKGPKLIRHNISPRFGAEFERIQ